MKKSTFTSDLLPLRLLNFLRIFLSKKSLLKIPNIGIIKNTAVVDIICLQPII